MKLLYTAAGLFFLTTNPVFAQSMVVGLDDNIIFFCVAAFVFFSLVWALPKFMLFGGGVIMFFTSILLLNWAKSAIHEILAAVVLLSASIFIVGALVIKAIEAGRKPQTTLLAAPQNEHSQ